MTVECCFSERTSVVDIVATYSIVMFEPVFQTLASAPGENWGPRCLFFIKEVGLKLLPETLLVVATLDSGST